MHISKFKPRTIVERNSSSSIDPLVGIKTGTIVDDEYH